MQGSRFRGRIRSRAAAGSGDECDGTGASISSRCRDPLTQAAADPRQERRMHGSIQQVRSRTILRYQATGEFGPASALRVQGGRFRGRIRSRAAAGSVDECDGTGASISSRCRDSLTQAAADPRQERRMPVSIQQVRSRTILRYQTTGEFGPASALRVQGGRIGGSWSAERLECSL
jgi:hypothetical protein